MSQSKIPLLIVNNAKKLIEQLVPSIIQIADRTGIKNIGQPNMEMPGSCLPQNELQEILTLKNNLIDKLNTASRTIETLSKPINTLNTVANTTSTILDTTDKARIAANIALAFVPLTPGAGPSAINTLKDLVELIKPQVQTLKNTISSISEALDYASNAIFKLLNLLKIIDQYLLQCGVNSSNLSSASDFVNQIDQQYTIAQTQQTSGSQVYQGFTLEVVEEPFSPTVNRRRAVAMNPQGIILLQTPLSFTSTPQILIQQLKLIIDNSDLKAV
jgi:chaperonin cofactor prefoldin